MTRTTIRLLLGALLILLAMPASGETTPEAGKWLEKLLSLYDRGPFKVDYSATLDMSSLGQPMAGTMRGTITQADRTHSRMELEMEMTGMPGTTEPMQIRMTNVTDGEVIWTEMNNPALGGTQVTRISLADADKMAQSMGGGLGSPSSMDPVAQLETLSRTMDFEVVETGGGTVTLRGTITAETRAKLAALAAPGVEAFILVLDERTGFPKEVRAAGEKPFVAMRFENLKFVDANALPAGLFEYVPAEGVPVMDLGAMLQ